MRGTVRPRELPSGEKRYDASFREGGAGSKWVWKTFRKRKDADDYINGQVTDVATGTYQRVKPAPMAEVFTKWLAAMKVNVGLGRLRRSTWRGYSSIVHHHLIPAFGRFRSDLLSKENVTEWKAASGEQIEAGALAFKTYNNSVGVLSSVLAWGREIGYLAHDPLPRKLRAVGDSEIRQHIEGAQLTAVWRAAAARGHQDLVIVALALFGGLRRGEIFGAPWAALAWPSRRAGATLAIVQAFVQRQIVKPKTAAGVRHVDLPDQIVALLRAHAKTTPPLAGPDGTAYLVRQDSGAPLDPDTWGREVWPLIQVAANLPSNVTLHGLRHSFASLLLGKGADPKLVSEQIGHKDFAFTRKQYGHVIKPSRAAAKLILERAIPIPKARPAPLRLIRGA